MSGLYLAIATLAFGSIIGTVLQKWDGLTGGFGSIPGALVGGVVVGIVEQMAGYYLPTGFQEVTSNIVLLAVLILRPQGLFGQVIRKRV